MSSNLRVSLVVLVAVATVMLKAEAPHDPSGHWQGAVSAPTGELRFELDLEKNNSGGYLGTLDIPGEKIAGLPLRQVVVDGQTIEFNARTDQTFRGELAADGTSMAGTFSVEGAALPFHVTRTGDARVHAAPRGSPIAGVLEGTWNGTMAANGMRLALKLANNSDGTSSVVMINMDEGNLQIPGSATQKGSSLTIEFAAIGGSYTATLGDDGSELAGRYSQGERSIALTFRRASAGR
jgi:hypothetical protein